MNRLKFMTRLILNSDSIVRSLKEKSQKKTQMKEDKEDRKRGKEMKVERLLGFLVRNKICRAVVILLVVSFLLQTAWFL